MKKKFVTNLALLILLNLLVKPFWIFGIDRTIQNIVGAGEYGFYFSLFNFSLILNILLDLGITNYNNKNIAQNNQLVSKHLSNIVVLKFLLAIFYFIASIGLAMIIGYDSRQIHLLFLLVFNQFLISLTLYLRSNISGLHFFKTDSFISVLDRLLMIIICSALLWGNITSQSFQIEWFVYAQTASYLITAFVSFLLVLAKSEFFKLNFDRNFFIVFLKQSYPYALLILLMSFYNRIDAIMLERLLPDGDIQAGIYAQAYRILEAATMFAFLFSTLLLPIFSKMIKLKQPVQQMLRLSYLLLIVPAFTLSIASVIYRCEIMELLYHYHVSESASIFGFLILGFISMSTTYIFGTLLTANGSMKYLNIMATIGMVLNILLNLILIPNYGALGSAIASFATQTFTALAQVILVKYIFDIKTNSTLLYVILLFVVCVIGISFTCKNYIDNWVVGFITIGIISMFIAFFFRLINLKSLYEIVRHDKND